MAEELSVYKTQAAYFERFGEAGDFDRWQLGPLESVPLMQAALTRGTPITPAEVAQAYEEAYGEPYPGDPPEGAVL